MNEYDIQDALNNNANLTFDLNQRIALLKARLKECDAMWNALLLERDDLEDMLTRRDES